MVWVNSLLILHVLLCVYRQYSEALLEILIAGGILAGGKVESDPIAIHCLFASQPTIEDIRPHMQVGHTQLTHPL